MSRLGGDVTGFALPAETKLGVFEAARVAQRVDSVLGDVRDPCSLQEVIDRCDPHVVFHLAAQPLVMRSYEDPVETLATNVMGTPNLLESLRRRPNLKAVVVVTSDKCYENREWSWGYREADRLGGFDPYSMSKACQELVVSSYRRALFGSADGSEVRLATARAGNVVGGGDWAEDRLVPDLIRAFVEGVPASIRNPESVRPWQHVLDPLAGYVGLAERMLEHERLDASYNFGPPDNDRWSVRKVADLLRDQWGDSATWHSSPVRQPHEADLLHLDSSNARQGPWLGAEAFDGVGTPLGG